MSDVKRFKYEERTDADGWDLLVEHPDGTYVLATDYDAAVARIAALEAALRKYLKDDLAGEPLREARISARDALEPSKTDSK